MAWPAATCFFLPRPGARELLASAGASSTRILGNTMRYAVRDKERWKRRRTPTQDPSTDLAAQSAAVTSPIACGRRDACWRARYKLARTLELVLVHVPGGGRDRFLLVHRCCENAGRRDGRHAISPPARGMRRG